MARFRVKNIPRVGKVVIARPTDGVLDLAKSSKPDEPHGKVLRFVFTCQADRTQTFGVGKKAKSVTAPCNKRMATYIEHGHTPRVIRCCFCYFVHKTSEVKASGHLVQEDLASVKP